MMLTDYSTFGGLDASSLLARKPDILAHSRRVADLVGYDATRRKLALYHDVLEEIADPALRPALRLHLGAKLWESLCLLTRTPGYTYAEYIQRIADSRDADAIAVKLADLTDHFNQSATLTDSLRKRYERAVRVLAYAADDLHRSKS